MPDGFEGIDLVDNRKGAVFDQEREYRYRLWRVWDVEGKTIAFIMLNPSTADEEQLDPTLRRCKAYAEAWGYGRMEIGNLFAFRSTNPSVLKRVDDPIGPENDVHLVGICEDADRVIVAWGTHGGLHGRAAEVLALLDECDLECLGRTKDGYPVHPLYQPKDRDPRPYGESL